MARPSERVLAMREILASRGLSLYQVSRRSAELYGRSSRFFVPHNLYSDLERGSALPTIHQILALSRITDYRWPDWLAALGVDLDKAVGIAASLPRPRTILLDSTVRLTNAWIPWFASRCPHAPNSDTAPLTRLVRSAKPKRTSELSDPRATRFLYARIGALDRYALPFFAPGSIVRVDTRHPRATSAFDGESGRFYLVEHRRGWACAQIESRGNGRVLVPAAQFPCVAQELEIGREARPLGIIDAEIRPMNSHRQDCARQEPRLGPDSLLGRNRGQLPPLRTFLRSARLRTGLSFRDGSLLSRLIAGKFSDGVYCCAASTLSDYETLTEAPRHVQKIVTLCVLYAIRFEEFLTACGIPLAGWGRSPFPDDATGQRSRLDHPALHSPNRAAAEENGGLVTSLVQGWGEVPSYLRFSLDEITGIAAFSISDLFWLGNKDARCDPLLVDASLIAVNRKSRKPPSDRRPACEQPLYVLLKRDGAYVCGRCTLDNRVLTVHRDATNCAGTERFRDGSDAEVVGRISAILRRFR